MPTSNKQSPRLQNTTQRSTPRIERSSLNSDKSLNSAKVDKDELSPQPTIENDTMRRRAKMHPIHANFSLELGIDVKVIAANERRTVRSLIGEAIDVILITRGYPARGER